MEQKNSDIPVSFTGSIVYAEPMSGRKVVDDDLEIYRPEDYDFTIDMTGESKNLSSELENKSGKVIGVIGEDEQANDSYARLPIAGSHSIESGVVSIDQGTDVKDRYELWATTDESGRVELDVEPPSSGLTGAISAILRSILPIVSPKSVPEKLKNKVEGRYYGIINSDLVQEAQEKQSEELQAEGLDIGLQVGELVTEEMADGSVRYNAFVIHEYTTESPVEINIEDEDLAV